MFHLLTMGALSNAIDENIYEDKPTFNFASVELLYPVVPISEDCSITVWESISPADPSKERAGWPKTFNQGSLDLLFKDFS
ncbi:hypothetical protein RHMOL_Rhmol02G0206800 [Rhododendron molle]|uniref:Uncharacterized protein n=1 Tax=Rhododendron molle TaxID=49168 RepID=A0ACC0PS13_RHOML|nr:hypothetical protein RHMOL_Rhmol02G0206800 [Rhododendron molle]